jgi:hypothetical protein
MAKFHSLFHIVGFPSLLGTKPGMDPGLECVGV